MSKELYDKRAKDVMSRALVTTDASDSVHDAIQLMAENKVAALPVVDRQNRCIGILSMSDLVEVTQEVDAGLHALDEYEESHWAAYLGMLGDHVGRESVMDLMSESVVGVGPDAPLFEAAGHMLREHVHRLPVIDAEERLLGIVSTTDILRAFVEGSPMLAS